MSSRCTIFGMKKTAKIKGLAAVELELTAEAATILVPAVNGQPGVAG